MDDLAAVLTNLESRPFDHAIHSAHIRLTQSLQEDPASAIDLMTSCIAAPEQAWLARIQPAEAAVDLNSAESVEGVLSVYRNAEEDYLSIPILKKHAEFVVSCFDQYKEVLKPEDLQDKFTVDWTREALTEIVNKALWHLTDNTVWDLLREWEVEQLDAISEAAKSDAVARVEKYILARLQQPHAKSEEVAQAYSSFTTKYKPADAYEPLLVAASKIRNKAAKSYQKRDRFETSLSTLENFSTYILSERRAKSPDWAVLSTLFERAIAEAARRRFAEEDGSDAALRTFWIGYCDTARILAVGVENELTIFQRAVRSVSGSGEVWARYIRCLERAGEEAVSSIPEIYDKALSMNLLQEDVEQLVPVVLARGAFEKRLLEASDGDEDRLITLVATLEAGVELVRKASPIGDARMRVEKFLAAVYSVANMEDSGLKVLCESANRNKTSYNGWLTYTDELIKHGQHAQARRTFVDMHTKNLDWPEALWEAWLAFEHLYGSVQEIEACGDKIEKAQYVVNTRRAKAAEKQAAQYAAMQMASVPVEQAPVPVIEEPTPMEVDAPTGPRGTKRAAEDASQDDGNKKPKLTKTAPLKRDRENCTVFVADLPADVTEDELVALFKDCGKVREVKIKNLSDAVVATVEMFDRDDIPAALTKDKKRIRNQEIAVHLAWKSTLYVANYPESTDDAALRALFVKYGTLFDVRWPSKKFKETRRFSYVQFTSPAAAEKALELHGRELEPGLPLTVLISNPERKKERTDADANERELYVAGLNRNTSKADLELLFKQYGNLKEVRLATDNSGHCKGFAFVEFDDITSAQAALEANNIELKSRRISVTIADSRVRSKNRNEPDSGLGKKADIRSRSVRVRNLPAGTQEGLLQQVLEKLAKVKRVEVFADLNEAVVELDSAADAGKLLLRTDAVVFEGNELKLSEESSDAAAAKKEGLFVPRAAKPRAGLGHQKARGARSAPIASGSRSAAAPAAPPAGGVKGQDDFRKLLG